MLVVLAVRIRKRLFVGLLCLCLFLMAGLLVYIWKAAFDQNSNLVHLVFIAVFLVMLAVIVLTAAGFFSLVLTLWEERPLPLLKPLAEHTVHFLYPFAIQVARLLQIAQEKVQLSFIEVNNQMVLSSKIRVKPDQLLLLLPHCLQWSECPYKITFNPHNCRRCGRCSIAGILKLADDYGINTRVATGGTFARAEIKRLQPQAILAVACERDLSSGIIDARPVPVLGVLNERPFGPCFNTSVNLKKIEKGLRFFLNGEPVGKTVTDNRG